MGVRLRRLSKEDIPRFIADAKESYVSEMVANAAAMILLEEEARRRGFGEIRLNVFGGNEVARSLYRSLGYNEFAIGMRKRLA